MNTIITKDGTQIYYRDWGSGQPLLFSHGWPLSGDAFEAQMYFLASRGYRCIAHDRRGHGRSSQPWHGNDMDTNISFNGGYGEYMVAPVSAVTRFPDGLSPAEAAPLLRAGVRQCEQALSPLAAPHLRADVPDHLKEP